MYKFSKSSINAMQGIDKRLQDILNEAIKIIDFTILEGLRTAERQSQLVKEGKSQTYHSKHLIGKAIDIVPYPIDWQDIKRFFYLAGIIKGIALNINVEIRWGGDWNNNNDFKDQTFNDYPHFELID